jgi:hypothetical protein
VTCILSAGDIVHDDQERKMRAIKAVKMTSYVGRTVLVLVYCHLNCRATERTRFILWFDTAFCTRSLGFGADHAQLFLVILFLVLGINWQKYGLIILAFLPSTPSMKKHGNS